MSNSNLETLTKRRTQLLDELWEVDKQLTRLEAMERERAGATRRSRRICERCGQRGECLHRDGRWACSRCRGIARSLALDARERPSASQNGAG